jgi:hypothetical protein
MWKSYFILNFLRLIAVIVIAAIAPEILLPEANGNGCPFVGPCHIWPDFMSGFIFILICVIFGPKHFIFQVLILCLVPLLGLLEPIRTGWVSSDTFSFWEFLLYLPGVTLVQGGVLGAMFGHGIIFGIEKFRNKRSTRH